MIVYGDPQFAMAAAPFLNGIRRGVAGAHADSIDDLRSLLIQLGQLEQSLADATSASEGFNQEILEKSQNITDLAASAFCSAWIKASGVAIPPSTGKPSLHLLSAALEEFELPKNFRINVKMPEGFEFYTLYPEQYCASALKWAQDHPGGDPLLVVGIRSIGTSLSAVVTAVLNALGRETFRLTVRPQEHPVERQVELPSGLKGKFGHALVVDDGPGISGSSMATVAMALAARGFTSVCFFPGHEGEPGSAALEKISRVWAETPRYVTRLDKLKWNGLSLLENLAKKSSSLEFPNATGASAPESPPDLPAPWRFIYTHAVQSLFGVPSSHPLPDSFDLIQDCSAGRWRQFAFRSEDEWPAAAPQLERLKFRCSKHEGCSVLWKFVGLGSRQRTGTCIDLTWRRLLRLSEKGFTPKPLGIFRGFIALPWIEGIRLTRAHAIDSGILKRIGEYVSGSAEPALTLEEQNESISRLGKMLFRNTKEAFGESMAEQTRAFLGPAQSAEITASAGDGHLAPHEWVLPDSSSTNILKLDCEGHCFDHTLVGRQPLYWDIASATVEWDLDLAAAAPLLTPIRQAGVEVDVRALRFYELAYAAFRMGLMSLSLSQTSAPSERSRIQSAFFYYQSKLAIALKVEALPHVAEH